MMGVKKKHNCNFDDPKRVGRAHYVCKECGKDITMELVFMYTADEKVGKLVNEERRF